MEIRTSHETPKIKDPNQQVPSQVRNTMRAHVPTPAFLASCHVRMPPKRVETPSLARTWHAQWPMFHTLTQRAKHGENSQKDSISTFRDSE